MRRLKITHKIFLLTLLPILFVIYLSTQNVLEALHTYRETQNTTHMHDVADAERHFQDTLMKQLALNVFNVLLIAVFATLLAQHILRRLAALQTGLERFFDYLNFQSDRPQEIVLASSNDELDQMAAQINAQVELIRQRREQDETFIDEIAQIVTLMREGYFGEHPYYEPYNPSLRALNEVFNDLILMIQDKIRAQTSELESINATLSDQVYTQTLALQNQLQELTQFKFAINESMMVTQMRPDGTLTHFNDLFNNTAKLDPHRVLDRSASLLLAPQNRDAKAEKIALSIAEHKVYKGILTLQRDDDSLFYTNSTIIPILDAYGTLVSVLGLHHDITPIIRARDEAIAAERAKDDFLSNMSHEIRTPLNAIMGFVTIVRKRITDEKSLHYLDIVNKSGESLLRIINDILDFSKIQSGTFVIASQPFEPLGELSQSVLLFASKAYEKGLMYYLYLDPKMHPCLEGDCTRIAQIFSNLLANAIKFTPQGGQIKVKIHLNDNHLRISVQDSGIGMTIEQQQRIFKPFEQADTSTTREYGGTGLGLSISIKLAELMQGTIHLISEPGKGSIFTLELPIKRCFSIKRPAFHTEKIAHLRILLVTYAPEDASAVKLIGKYFDDFGISYTTSDLLEGAIADLVIVGAHTAAVAYMIAHEMHAIIFEMIPSGRFENYPHMHRLSAPFAPLELMRVLDQATVEKLHEGENNSKNTESTPQFNAHLLVAEDNSTNQILITSLLEEVGITYELVSDGTQAVAAYEANPKRYDLFLTDENMPKLSGIGALKQIRQYEQKHAIAPIPVVVLTASVMQSDQNRFLNAGMDGFIGKPIEEERLFKILKRFLKTGESSQ